MKISTIFVFLAMAVSAQAEADQESRFLDIAKNANGSICYMIQSYEYLWHFNSLGAVEYCKDPKYVPQPAYLASARELAVMASRICSTVGSNEPCGAKGIANSRLDDSYHRIIVKNADGTPDSFFYSNTGYRRPGGDLGSHWFWSSSVLSESSSYAYAFEGDSGYLYYYYRSYDNGAVRCVSNR